MDPLAVAQRYFDAWNARDPEAIAATFAPGGTYSDPNVPDGLDPQATGSYAAGLFASFPDLRFDLTSKELTAAGTVAAQWTMVGTNTEPFRGLPPTGRAVSVPGADFISVEGEGVKRVEGYFDAGTMVRQLGLDVIVQPSSIGPFSFGTSTYVSSKDAEPGAISMTVLEARSDEEREQVRMLTRQIVTELLGMPGFIGWVGAVIGRRMFTFTAWETPEATAQLLEGGTHKEAMTKFFGPELAAGGQTGVWAPHHLNGVWVRCAGCGEMVRPTDDNACRCGAELPASPRWF